MPMLAFSSDQTGKLVRHAKSIQPRPAVAAAAAVAVAAVVSVLSLVLLHHLPHRARRIVPTNRCQATLFLGSKGYIDARTSPAALLLLLGVQTISSAPPLSTPASPTPPVRPHENAC